MSPRRPRLRLASSDPMEPERIFYDGACGLCHGAVAFAVRRDRGDSFRYAPLGGPTFSSTVPPSSRSTLPDSLAVLTSDGHLLVRSSAVLHVLRRLGGGWAVLARVAGLFPTALRDAVYDRVARVRYRLFARPSQVCPLLPPGLASRFDP